MIIDANCVVGWKRFLLFFFEFSFWHEVFPSLFTLLEAISWLSPLGRMFNPSRWPLTQGKQERGGRFRLHRSVNNLFFKLSKSWEGNTYGV